MPKTNRKRGEIDLPGFGSLRFDIFALEAIEEVLGDNWLPALQDKLAGLHLATIKLCLEVGSAHWQDTADYSILNEPGGVTAAVDAIFEAISWSVFGKSHADVVEQAEKEQAERAAKRMKQMEENPLLAAAWLRDLGILDTSPDSAPETSEDSPQ